MATRRQFIATSLATLGTLALTRQARTASEDLPALGLIVPPALPWEPVEGLELYKGQMRYLVEGLGLKRLSPEGYDSVVGLIAPYAEKLAAKGAKAIVLMGTSLSFYKGAAFNQRLEESMQKASGVPSITMSTAIVEGLKAVGAKRVVSATAYTDVVNDRLAAFLKENGLETTLIKGLDITDINAVRDVTTQDLIDFGARVAAEAPASDALLMSCGGLKTLDVLAPLEAKAGLPVVSSTPHAYWAGARLLGLSGQAQGYGMLLAKG